MQAPAGFAGCPRQVGQDFGIRTLGEVNHRFLASGAVAA
jgi:hypothetical protein